MGGHKGQYISKKRPSRFVILSGAKDLCPARDPSLRSEPALERSEGMTILNRLRLTRNTSYSPGMAHFMVLGAPQEHGLFEMYCP